jgi:ComF family protein
MFAARSSWLASCEALLELAYPKKCALCGLLENSSPCETCIAEMVPAEPFVKYERAGLLDFRASLFLYEGRAAQAVRRLKYARSTSLAAFMATEIKRGVEQLGFVGDVVPVPIHWTRFYSRGFNQALLLATDLNPDQRVLHRTRATRPQVGLNKEQRMKNLDGAFAADAAVKGRSILLIDDVVTSGQTARECARALREQEAREVGILAFCGEAGWD